MRRKLGSASSVALRSLAECFVMSLEFALYPIPPTISATSLRNTRPNRSSGSSVNSSTSPYRLTSTSRPVSLTSVPPGRRWWVSVAPAGLGTGGRRLVPSA